MDTVQSSCNVMLVCTTIILTCLCTLLHFVFQMYVKVYKINKYMVLSNNGYLQNDKDITNVKL